MAKRSDNLGATVLGRLKTLARQQGSATAHLIAQFAHERLLYRLGESRYGEQFALKGGMLVRTWLGDASRVTRDIDLWALELTNPDTLRAIFQEVMAMPHDDGVIYDHRGIETEAIITHAKYQGTRLTAKAYIDKAWELVIVDVGGGGAVPPGMAPAIDNYQPKPLLGFPSPRISAYPIEFVIAEKFHAIARWGVKNTRAKDFYDVYMLRDSHLLSGDALAQVIASTFRDSLPAVSLAMPVSLSPEFAASEQAERMWGEFARRANLEVEPFTLVAEAIRDFIAPHVRKAASIAASKPGEGNLPPT